MSTENTHGIQLSYMDRNADPGRDFFRFANGAWLDNTPIPPAYPRWGAFLMLRDRALETVHGILQAAAANTDAVAGSNEQKIGDFFAAGMDETAIEAAGLQPLAAEFARIDRVRTRGQFASAVARLHMIGADVFFGFGGGADYKNSSQVIAQAGQDGLGLPDRDYYTKTDKRSVELRRKYVLHVQRMFQLLGHGAKKAAQAARAVMRIETRLAKASSTQVELRDPEANYHKMCNCAFERLTPHFPMRRYLADLGCAHVTEVNVGQPAFLKAFDRLVDQTSMADLKTYMRWHLINAFGGALSSAFVNEKFDFFGRTLQGSKELLPRWKRMVEATSGSLGEAVGEVYVRDNFSPEAKTRMLELVANVTAALRETLTKVDWMSEPTRKNALAKLDSFVAKIGYPDKWRDYSELHIDRKSYVANVIRAREFGAKKHLAKIGKPVDRTEWGMFPQTVNAYYSPLKNEIVFPAAILQAPFFDPLADDAANYGGIAVVIGHEMTHGYDDKGSQFDAQGNMRDWWTAGDRAGFEGRIDRIREQYGAFQVAGGEHLQGNLVSGEAAADLGGLKLAYMALMKVLAGKQDEKDATGFTHEQRFFIAFAQIWASKATPEYERMQAANDPHPPGNHRTNGTLANVPEFARAFGLPEGCPMMLPPEKRCELW